MWFGRKTRAPRMLMGGALQGLANSEALELAAGPLRAGADVSWLRRCRVGDDQGQDGACVMFAFANWAEIMRGVDISDKETLLQYQRTLKRVGRTSGGLTPQEGFVGAKEAGWLPDAKGIRPVRDFAAMHEQPLLGSYRVTPAFDSVNKAGCLNHRASDKSRGLHFMCTVAYGEITGVKGGPYVYVENSWGEEWGYKGFGLMMEALARRLCRELYVVV